MGIGRNYVVLNLVKCNLRNSLNLHLLLRAVFFSYISDSRLYLNHITTYSFDILLISIFLLCDFNLSFYVSPEYVFFGIWAQEEAGSLFTALF